MEFHYTIPRNEGRQMACDHCEIKAEQISERNDLIEEFMLRCPCQSTAPCDLCKRAKDYV